jgi:ABC-type antimicrobial peptide transport system permease subunit
VVARATVSPDAALARLRAAVREVDPAIAPYELRTLQAMAVDVVATERFVMVLLAVFAGLAVVLCAVGVYGVMSYFVGQQQQEFGIRVALGASPVALGRLVVARIARLAAGGVGLGLMLTALAGPVVRGLVGPQASAHPAIIAAAAAMLTIVALLAGVRPAVQAMRVDPVATIKS